MEKFATIINEAMAKKKKFFMIHDLLVMCSVLGTKPSIASVLLENRKGPKYGPKNLPSVAEYSVYHVIIT